MRTDTLRVTGCAKTRDMACQGRTSARPRGLGRPLAHTPVEAEGGDGRERLEWEPELAWCGGQRGVVGGRLVGAGSGGARAPGVSR